MSDLGKQTDNIKQLQGEMQKKGIDWYLIPTADYHDSEYVTDYFKGREFISGFTGSNGTLLVSQNWAGLWTDGRYFIQAEQELKGTGITLYKMQEMGVPTILAYLEEKVTSGQVLAYDGLVTGVKMGLQLEERLKDKSIVIRYEEDLLSSIWTDRPAFPHQKIVVLPEEISGEKASAKIAKVRSQLIESGADYLLLTKLDDIMWLLNLRGSDIPCNPVALSYVFLSKQEIYLFVQSEAITAALTSYTVQEGICLQDYRTILSFLQQYDYGGSVALDKEHMNVTLYQTIRKRAEVLFMDNPTSLWKAQKNQTEQQNMRAVYLRDSVAVTKFIYWVKKTVPTKKITEMDAAEYLDALRKQTEGFLDLSFPTISAYLEHAAMMHYQATTETNKSLEPKGSLLVDSGGQYRGGTTDVTRTIALGPLTDAFCTHFTYVLQGMLRLQNARFLYGCTGRNLDILARSPLWNQEMDYKCGTGHGIGYMLNVHEGPQSIRWSYNKELPEIILEEGMVLSNEPGVYIEHAYGIRTENIMLCQKGHKNIDGQFMYFEPLTYVPIDREAIKRSLLSQEDRQRLDEYHAQVSKRISPYLNAEEKAWLQEVTAAI